MFPNPEIFQDNDYTVVFPHPDVNHQAFMGITNSSKGMSLGRNTMQAFGNLISPERQGSLDRANKDNKRPKILVQNDDKMKI